MLQYLQRIGKAIMLPIAALPVAGILLGVGGSLINIAALENAPAIYQPLIAFVNIPMITIILKIMQGIGDIVFGNLPVLFAVGTAVGLAKQDKGTAALASVFGFLIMNQVIGVLLGVGATPLGTLVSGDVPAQYAQYVTTTLGIFTLNMSVFGGIITGIVTATLHYKYYNIQLPAVIGFFSGARFVPIVVSLAMAVVGALLAYIWPFVQDGIAVIALFVKNAGPIGTFLYGLIERALIPFGLHHMLTIPVNYTELGGVYTALTGASAGVTIAGQDPLWFAWITDLINLKGAGDMTTYNNIISTVVPARFKAGQVVLSTASLMGVALAMYKNVDADKKSKYKSMFISTAIAVFLTVVSEPIEFLFMFLT